MLKMTPENQARAAVGSQAVAAHQIAKRGAEGSLFQSAEESLTDLLSDLRHFADAAGIDFDTAERAAQDRYEHETW